MKRRVVFNNEQKDIVHIDDVHRKDILFVKKENIPVGIIIHDGERWSAGFKGQGSKKSIFLLDLISWFGDDCEFYVLD